MPNEDPNYIDLYDLKLDTQPSYDWRDGSMRKQEDLITEELTKMGYTVIGHGWFDGEKDSFGPLSRCLTVRIPEGQLRTVVYG